MKISHLYSIFFECYCYIKKKYYFWVTMLFKLMIAFLSFLIASKISSIIAALGKNYNNRELLKSLSEIMIFFSLEILFKFFSFRMVQGYEKDSRIYIKEKVVDIILLGKVKYDEENSVSKMQAIVMTDCFSVISFVTSIQETVFLLLYIAVSFLIMLLINPILSLIIVFTIVIYAFLSYKKAKKIKKLTRKLMLVSDEHFAIVKTIVMGVRTIKSSLATDIVKKKYKDNIEEAKRLSIESENAQFLLNTEGEIFKVFWIVWGLVFLFCFIEENKQEVSYVIFFYFVGKILCNSLVSFIQKIAQLKIQQVSVERFLALMKNEAGLTIKKRCFPCSVSMISIQDLSFQYKDVVIFSRINLIFEKGINIVIGKNGIGKTTLLNLVANRLEETEGNIYINHIPISSIDEKSFYENVACCFHDDMVFDWTIKENILLKDNPEEEHEMRNICEKIGFLNDILSLEKGFNTRISDIRDFSYGQKKKILLARTLIREKQVYIFDEPLEGLDIISCQKVVNLFEELGKKKIIIISTHRREMFSEIKKEILL